MEPSHPIVISRLAGIFICALPAVRELYQYINDPRYLCFYVTRMLHNILKQSFRKAVRMGQHAWLLAATVCTEALLIVKWGRGVFTEPFPQHIKFSLILGCLFVLLYPAFK